MHFTTLHCIQRGISHERTVCPSVRLSACPSVTRVKCDRKTETYAHIIVPNERAMPLSLRREEWLVGMSRPFYLRFYPLLQKTPISYRNSLVAP